MGSENLTSPYYNSCKLLDYLTTTYTERRILLQNIITQHLIEYFYRWNLNQQQHLAYLSLRIPKIYNLTESNLIEIQSIRLQMWKKNIWQSPKKISQPRNSFDLNKNHTQTSSNQLQLHQSISQKKTPRCFLTRRNIHNSNCNQSFPSYP